MMQSNYSHSPKDADDDSIRAVIIKRLTNLSLGTEYETPALTAACGNPRLEPAGFLALGRIR